MRIDVGTHVKYKMEFLRSIGCFTGDMPFARGTVTALYTLSQDTILATIDWKNDFLKELPTKVNVRNLTLTNNPESV